MRLSLPLLVGALLLAAGGCAGHSKKTLEARSALNVNDAEKARGLFNDLLEVDDASKIPAELEGDAALFLLDRAMVSQQLSDYENSSNDLQFADKTVEMLDFNRSGATEIGRYLFSDDVGKYRARPYEKLFINTMNLVNYLSRGNLEGARIEARRFATMQKYLEDEEGARASMLAPGSYLAGFTYEKSGNFDEAIRYYDEALRSQPYASLTLPVLRLSQYSGYRSPKLTELIDAAGEVPAEDPEDQSGELLIVISYGRVPALIPKRIPVGLAITYAAAFMPAGQLQAARRMAGQGLVTWVNLPQMGPSPKTYPRPNVVVGGQAVQVDHTMHVDDVVRQSWEEGRGPVIAAALVRTVTRIAVGQGVQHGAGNGALGMVLSLGTQAALTARDTPDTRSWVTLPARIGFARIRLPPGKHQVKVDVLGFSQTREVVIDPKGWATANFTQLRMPAVPAAK